MTRRSFAPRPAWARPAPLTAATSDPTARHAPAATPTPATRHLRTVVAARHPAPRLVGALVTGGLALAACSSASHHASSAIRGSSPPASHSSSGAGQSPTSTVPTSSSVPVSSGSSTASSTTCRASGLVGTLSGEQGGAGTLEVTVALRNSGATACTMKGYPGLQLVGAGGSVQSTSVQPGGSLSFESVAPTVVTLAAGQVAYFNIGFSDVPGSGQTSCSTSTAVQVTPPGATGHIVVPVQVQACSGGLHVSAVFASQSPAAQTAAPPAAG